jgi:hypothetical protein
MNITRQVAIAWTPEPMPYIMRPPAIWDTPNMETQVLGVVNLGP